jgi:hypothetical protein
VRAALSHLRTWLQDSVLEEAMETPAVGRGGRRRGAGRHTRAEPPPRRRRSPHPDDIVLPETATVCAERSRPHQMIGETQANNVSRAEAPCWDRVQPGRTESDAFGQTRPPVEAASVLADRSHPHRTFSDAFGHLHARGEGKRAYINTPLRSIGTAQPTSGRRATAPLWGARTTRANAPSTGQRVPPSTPYGRPARATQED